jgi:allantoin racemase
MKMRDIKILIINPNSNQMMTEAIQRTAVAYADGDFIVDTVSTPGAPEFIDYYMDAAKAAPGMLKLFKENEDQYDGFVVACHSDPNLDLLKEISSKPVVGIGEASMKLATMLGHSFSVISTAEHSIPNKQTMIQNYHLEKYNASVRAPKNEHASLSAEEIFLNTAKSALDEDLAEVIVLGCAGLSGLDKNLSRELEIPVLDSIVSALVIVTGLVKAGLSISKKRRYSGIQN